MAQKVILRCNPTDRISDYCEEIGHTVGAKRATKRTRAVSIGPVAFSTRSVISEYAINGREPHPQFRYACHIRYIFTGATACRCVYVRQLSPPSGTTNSPCSNSSRARGADSRATSRSPVLTLRAPRRVEPDRLATTPAPRERRPARARHPSATASGSRSRETGESALHAEYEDYRRIFETDSQIGLEGDVTSGMGEGRHYISLSGYQRQFEGDSATSPSRHAERRPPRGQRPSAQRHGLAQAVPIDGWGVRRADLRPAVCYPRRSRLPTARPTRTPSRPERTHHDDDQLEVIAPKTPGGTLPRGRRSRHRLRGDRE